MKLSRYEQETVINYNVAEQNASVYTADPNMMKKIDKLVAQFPEVFRVETVTEVSKSYLIAKEYIKIRKPRMVSEEQREQARANMKQINQNGKYREKKL